MFYMLVIGRIGDSDFPSVSLYVPGNFVASNMAGRSGYDERDHRQVNKYFKYVSCVYWFDI